MFHSGIVKSPIGVFVACLVAAAFTAAAHAQQDVPIAVGDVQAQVEQALATGQDQLDQEEYDAAINTFSQIIQYYGDYSPAAAYIGRAKAFAALQEYGAARRDFSSAIEQNERSAEAYNGRGEIQLMFSSMSVTYLQDALNDFLKAVENDRTNPTYAINLAKAYVRGFAPREALASVNRALRMDEDNAEAYRTRAHAHALLQDFNKATADIARASDLEPDNHENHYVMGMIHMQNKQHLDAVAAFYRAKQTYKPKDPENPVPYVEPHLAASLAYIELGKEANIPQAKQEAYVKAVEETQRALDEQPLLPLAYLNRGVALRLLELYRDALDAFSQTIQLAPEFAEAYFRRGIVWYHMHEMDLARKDFREAIAINYDDVRPYLWMGVSFADQRNYHDAITQYSAAINLNPRYVPAYVNRGLAYAQLGEFERAQDNFADAIRLEPNEPRHYFKRGTVLMALERYDDALQAFSNAIRNAPYYVDAYRKAAESLQRLGRTDLAAQYRQQANEIEATINEQLDTLRRQQEGQQGQIGRTDGLPGTGALPGPEATPGDVGGGFGAVNAAAEAPLAVPVPFNPDPAIVNPFEGFGP